MPVGEIKHFVERHAVHPFRHADTAAHRKVIQNARLIPITQENLNPGYYIDGGGRVGIRQHDQEFIPTVTNGSVRTSDRAFEQRGDFGKHEVAGQVTEPSIDLFEAVHVNEQESERSSNAPGLTDDTAGEVFDWT